MKHLPLALLLPLLFASDSQALSFLLEFQASGFGASAPQDPVSGNFIYSTSGGLITDPIASVTAVNLTIDGHAYTIGDVGAAISVGASVIGGASNGILVIPAMTDDFLIAFDHTTSTGLQFTYVTSSTSALSTTNFDSFSIAPIPEPSSAFVWAALACCTVIRRRSC